MISAEQLERVTGHAVALHEAGDYAELAAAATGAFADLVPCEWASAALLTGGPPPRHVRASTNRPGLVEATDVDFSRYQDADPAVVERLRLVTDWPAVLSAGRAVGGGRRRPSLFDEVYRPAGAARVLWLPDLAGYEFDLAIVRGRGPAFTPADALVVRTLARHLQAATARLAAAAGGHLPINGRPVAVPRTAWLVCDPAGVVIRGQPAAVDRLRVAAGVGGSIRVLPVAWVEQMRLRATGRPYTPPRFAYRGNAVTVHLAPIRGCPGEWTAFFAETPPPADPLRPLRRLGLTGREAEVLHRVAGGMTNAQVAVELGTSPLTVKKQLEGVYHKLGVANRTAAVAWALAAAGG